MDTIANEMSDSSFAESEKTMTHGTCQALLEFSKKLSKKGGYQGNFSDDFETMAKDCFTFMITALTEKRPINCGNEFDEAEVSLRSYNSRNVHTQLNKEKAKKGNKIEIVKFFAAFVYEYRLRRCAEFLSLCESLSRIDRVYMGHFISCMDTAIKEGDNEWWKILFLTYSDEGLNDFGRSLRDKAIHTPRRTISRRVFSNMDVVEDLASNISDSPNGKNQTIQHYEQYLKAINEHIKHILPEHEELQRVNDQLKQEMEALELKLGRSSRNAPSTCGDGCPNKIEMDSLRLKMNIRNNKILGLNAELSAVRQELDSSSKTMKELLGERDRLEEKVRGLGEENTELSNTFDEVQKLRQRFDTINKETEELLAIRNSMSHGLSAEFHTTAEVLGMEPTQDRSELARHVTEMLAEQLSSESQQDVQYDNPPRIELSAYQDQLDEAQLESINQKLESVRNNLDRMSTLFWREISIFASLLIIVFLGLYLIISLVSSVSSLHGNRWI